jgi:hypothetical protein
MRYTNKPKLNTPMQELATATGLIIADKVNNQLKEEVERLKDKLECERIYSRQISNDYYNYRKKFSEEKSETENTTKPKDRSEILMYTIIFQAILIVVLIYLCIIGVL